MLSKISNIIKKRPTQAVIETTNHCNLNCPYCMVGKTRNQADDASAPHSLMSRPMGYMDETTFELVFCELRKFGIRKVYLHFQGEPFLNPLTANFAKQLKNADFFVGIFTNGQAFDDNNIAEIAGVEVDLIRFSVDGASEETYCENRKGGTFAKVAENMQKIVDAHKGKSTRIEWQFLPMKNNEHEIETAKKMAEKIGINFFTKGYRETDEKRVPADAKLRSSHLAKPCIDILRQLAVYWNGDVVPCCYDVDGFEIMGNIKNNSLTEIWNSVKYREFRKNVKNQQNEPEICKQCLRWK